MKKRIFYLLLCGIIMIVLAGCNSSNRPEKENNITNENEVEQESKNESEFEQAINNLKNAKSVTIDYSRRSYEVNSDYEVKSKYKFIIDYKNNKIKKNMYYLYLSLRPDSDTSSNVDDYWDISLKREYAYDEACKKWWYYEDTEITEPVYSALEQVKTFTDERITKKVGNNYRVVGDESFDILVENNKIKGIVYSPKNSQKVSTTYEITFENYDQDYVTFPSEVKNAISESELNRVCED